MKRIMSYILAAAILIVSAVPVFADEDKLTIYCGRFCSAEILSGTVSSNRVGTGACRLF